MNKDCILMHIEGIGHPPVETREETVLKAKLVVTDDLGEGLVKYLDSIFT